MTKVTHILHRLAILFGLRSATLQRDVPMTQVKNILYRLVTLLGLRSAVNYGRIGEVCLNKVAKDERQQAKEEAILLALKRQMALVRRGDDASGFSIHGMFTSGETILISESFKYEDLWHDALAKLQTGNFYETPNPLNSEGLTGREVEALLLGTKIPAIQSVRRRTEGLSLRAAKEFVDKIVSDNPEYCAAADLKRLKDGLFRNT